MKIGLVGRSRIAVFIVFAFLSPSAQVRAQFAQIPAESAFSIPEAQLLKPEAYPRIGIRRAGITASRNRATAESGELASAKKAHCALLRLLSLESLSEPWAGVREIARHGFYQCEGTLSCQQLRRGLGRQGVSS